jgi:hypothetical protein
MKPSFVRAARTRNPDAATRWLRSLLLLLLGSSSLLLQGCHRDAERRLKSAVLGSWEEVRGTKETLQFNADGILVMESPSQQRICLYDIPDYAHIRFDCNPAGTPASPQLYGISVTADDKLLITEGQEVGTYRRK